MAMYLTTAEARNAKLPSADEQIEKHNASLNPGLKTWHPEMGDVRPDTKIEAQRAFDGNHYFLYCAFELPANINGKGSKGVTFLGTVKPGDMVNSRRDGWHKYKVTNFAFHSICKSHAVAFEMLLD